MNQTSPRVVIIVIASLSLLALICSATLCLCALHEVKPDQLIAGALISTTGALVGAISSVLNNTRGRQEEGQKDAATPVTITNAPTDPVPTVETPKKAPVTDPNRGGM